MHNAQLSFNVYYFKQNWLFVNNNKRYLKFIIL